MFKKTNIFNYLTKFYFPYRNLLLDKLLKIRHNKILFGKDIKLHNYKKIKLGKHILINDNFCVIGNGLVKIDDFTYTAPNVTIITTSHKKENMDKVIGNVNIESLCWIGSNVTILQGVSIGEGSIIGAGSVVSKNIDPYSIAYGSPIEIISKRHITYPYRLPGGKFYLMKKDLIVSHFDV